MDILAAGALGFLGYDISFVWKISRYICYNLQDDRQITVLTDKGLWAWMAKHTFREVLCRYPKFSLVNFSTFYSR